VVTSREDRSPQLSGANQGLRIRCERAAKANKRRLRLEDERRREVLKRTRL